MDRAGDGPAERSIREAAGHLARARAVLAKPWTQDAGVAPLYLGRACECLRAATGQDGPGEAAAVLLEQLRRELAAVKILLIAASAAHATSLEAAGLISGTYSPDGECEPSPRPGRISARA